MPHSAGPAADRASRAAATRARDPRAPHPLDPWPLPTIAHVCDRPGPAYWRAQRGNWRAREARLVARRRAWLARNPGVCLALVRVPHHSAGHYLRRCGQCIPCEHGRQP